MNNQAWEIMYTDLRLGYNALQGEHERLKDHCDELGVAYNNAQKEIHALENRIELGNQMYSDGAVKNINISLKNQRLSDQNKLYRDAILEIRKRPTFMTNEMLSNRSLKIANKVLKNGGNEDE